MGQFLQEFSIKHKMEYTFLDDNFGKKAKIHTVHQYCAAAKTLAARGFAQGKEVELHSMHSISL